VSEVNVHETSVDVREPLPPSHSQEIIDFRKLPALNTLAVESPKFPTSSSVETQSIPMNPTSLVPALLNVDSVTSVMMVVDPIPVAPTTVTTSGSLCQDNHHFDPCIDLLGGEILSAQLYLLSAEQVPKKFHPLDSTHPDLMDPWLHVMVQSTIISYKSLVKNESCICN